MIGVGIWRRRPRDFARCIVDDGAAGCDCDRDRGSGNGGAAILNQGDCVNVCMSPGKLVPGAPGSALLNSRGYFVRVKCVTAHAQSIKSRGLAAHASAIKRGVMSSTLRTLRRSDQVFSHKRRRSINVATTLQGGNDCANECIIIERARRDRLNVPKISSPRF